MLICSMHGEYNFALDSDLLDELEDLFKAGIIVPVKSFGQYVNNLVSDTKKEPTVYNKKVAKYFGTDIAKTIADSKDIIKVYSREKMISELKYLITLKTGSTLIGGSLGYTVVICDVTTKKIIFSLPNHKLEDYQERLNIDGSTQYVSRFGNFMIMMPKKDTQPLDNESLKTSNLLY